MTLDTNTLLIEFSETFMPAGFNWRPGQKEAITSIIDAYHGGSKVVVLDAPVGSGKSIIAVAVSWILNQHKKYGYILASDIALQEQYESDIELFNMRYGSVKGVDNYHCTDNMEKHSLGTCKIRNRPPKQMYCYSGCPYFSARDFASKSPTSILNYAYWLIMQNYVNEHMDEEDQLFPARDFTICDEAHKILDIVQNHFSPRFDKEVLRKLKKLTDFFGTYKIHDHDKDYKRLKIVINALSDFDNQNDLFEILKRIELLLEEYTPSIELIKERIKKEYPKDDPPKPWKEALRLCDWLKDFHCKIEDYVDIIDKTSTRNIVKNPGIDDITFNCLEESYMMKRYFHEHTGFTLLMSATFADPRDYLKSISVTDAKYIKMDSTFDFTRSPIYFYNKRRMSYNHIAANAPWLYSKINEILDNHPSENGLIHSASYKLTMDIHNNLSEENKNRVLIYEGTAEKRQLLSNLKANNNKVLIGPSLLEGLDLKDGFSRFAIFAKVPYLSLADKFVKTKMQIDPKWYSWKAVLNILQGIGRSVRNENDWAVSYILDGSFGDLIHKNRRAFPPEFMQRIKIKE